MSDSVHPRPLVLLRLAVIVLVIAPLTLAVPPLMDALDRPEAIAPATSGPALITDDKPVMGVAIVAHHIGDLSLYLESVDRIADLGANAVTVVTPRFVRHVDSSTIRHLPKKCPTDQQLLAIFRRARERGLRTALQPIVLIEKPGEKDWRGVLRPADWNAWWTSYREMIEHFLGIASSAGVDLFTIGSELNSTEDHLERWSEIAALARARFAGALTYSANWDRYDKVGLWPLVDAVSVSAYFELQRHDPDAPESALADDWRVERRKLLEAAARWDRPLILSEVGYPSLPWASAHPWNYVAERGTAADHAAQARCYRAFFTAWSETVADPTSRTLGFFCYHWDPYHRGGEQDTGYGLDGKPSLGVIRESLAAIKADHEARGDRGIEGSRDPGIEASRDRGGVTTRPRSE